MNPPNAILHELLNLAEIMLTNGAEVSRVEETLNRMGHAYGATQMNVFAITSSIVVTMSLKKAKNIHKPEESLPLSAQISLN